MIVVPITYVIGQQVGISKTTHTRTRTHVCFFHTRHDYLVCFSLFYPKGSRITADPIRCHALSIILLRGTILWGLRYTLKSTRYSIYIAIFSDNIWSYLAGRG